MKKISIFLFFTFLTTLQVTLAQSIRKVTDIYKEIKSVQFVQRGEKIFIAGCEENEKVLISSLNKDLTTAWKKEIKGYLISFQNLDNALLLLVSTDFSKFKGPNNTLIAYTLDLYSGSIKAQKTVFTEDDQFLITQKVIISRDKKTFSLVSRKTLTKRMNYSPVFEVTQVSESEQFVKEVNGTSSFTISSFNEKLDAVSKLSPILPPGDLIDVVRAPNNDFFIATAQGSTSVTISRYEAGKESSTDVITEPFNYSPIYKQDRLYKLLRLIPDSVKNNIVYLQGALPKEKSSECIFNLYNFTSKEHKRFSKSIAREELKAIEKNYQPIPGFKSLDLGSVETLHFLRALESENGFLLVLSSIRYYPRTQKADGYAFRTDNGGRTTYSPGKVGQSIYESNTFPAGGLIIYALDKDLKFKSMSTVPRASELEFQAEFNAWHKGGSWFVIATSGLSARCIMAKVNDATGNVEEVKFIEPTKTNPQDYVSLNQAMFTDQRIILPIRDHKPAWGGIEFDLDIHQFDWQLLKK